MVAARAREAASQVDDDDDDDDGEAAIDGAGGAAADAFGSLPALVFEKRPHRFSRRLRRVATLSPRGGMPPEPRELARSSAAKPSAAARRMPTRRSDDDVGFFLFAAGFFFFGPPPPSPPLGAPLGIAAMRWRGVGSRCRRE